jgi:hypothetical protein
MTFRFPKRNMTREADYGAKRVEHAGRSFMSKLEAAVFDLLSLREKAGEIRNLRCQVHIYLSEARIGYIPDFGFEFVATSEPGFAEAKGFESDIWKLKKRLWKAYGPGPLEIWKGSHKKPKLIETVYPVQEKQLALGSSSHEK